MPFHGVLGTLEQLHIELTQPDSRFHGGVWQRRLRLLMREACYLKLLLVPMVLAIAVRWESMIPLLLSLAGLYLATEAFTALCPLPESSGVSTSTKCEQISAGHWSRIELNGFLRSEFVLGGAILLVACESLLHLDTAILLPLLVLMALLLHMLFYGALVTLVQCGEWGASWQLASQRHRRLRRGLHWGAPHGLSALLWMLKLGLLLAGGALLLCHLPGLKELLSYLQMAFALYAYQPYWIWPLCLLLGVLAGLWGRWLITVVGYFTPVKPSVPVRQVGEL